MLYSQQKERSNRFALALRIATPFIIILFIWGYAFVNLKNYKIYEIILFALLTFIYVYYTFYMIYNGFNTSLIDQSTGSFTRDKIINKSIKNGEKKYIIMISIKNLNEIANKYRLGSVDKVSKQFLEKLHSFLEKNSIRKVPIGKYIDGCFILLIDSKFSKFNNLLKSFELSILRDNIDNIELNLAYNNIRSDYDLNLNVTLSTLFYMILDRQNELKINESKYEKMIFEALRDKNFIFKFQTIKSNKNSDDMTYVMQRLKLPNSNISKIKFSQVINRIGYEIFYDKEVLRLFFSRISKDIKGKIFIEISPVSLRNYFFKAELFKMIKKYNINAKNLVFEFFEDKFYDEISNFNNIINEYKKFGFSFALSHFGGKNSSFEYLKYLNIDYIIYDIEFSKNLHKDRFKMLFNSVNSASKALDIKTIIRFISSNELYEIAKNSEVDYIQGFYIEKPKLNLKD
ncbi:EAL domain-containing protein [Campylobacter fetus]|nr:EAL domain-containing protein [Campylobacter fetus]EAI5944775.1 EAL domain-containing protein [Campylobacter fetus]EAJ0319226.1 EAL domain-containing protein [Campylobacter fetus]EAJ0345110.1 EAL domain-containing protein [Campylobacter fetus]EAJ1238547.1 EAL domain-containing protein [Campylobacter fetus]